MQQSQDIPVDQIDPDPNQPRQEFEPVALQELADSIIAEGLIQPITVRPLGDRFQIVAGERRWRAHKLAGLATIPANVRVMDDQTKMVQALIENSVRKDVTPLEEAVAFQRCLDTGMTVEDLARRLGMNQAWRITERTCLLTLRAEYQFLLRTKQISSSQGYEMAQLSPAGQDRLFAIIRVGGCDSYTALRAAALAIRDGERQVSFLDEDGPSESEKRLAKGLEARFSQVIKVLQASTVDNEVVAVRKISPDRASTLADMAQQMRAELARIEAALRGPVQTAFAA